MYVLTTGCQWTAIPKDLPPRTTLNEYFRRWDYDGTLVRIHQVLCGICPKAIECRAGLEDTMVGKQGGQIVNAWASASVSAAALQDTKRAPGNGVSW
jgi:transposase